MRPRFVDGWAELMAAAVLDGRENARASLPSEFQDQPVIERIDAVIEERCTRLAKALGEPREP